MKKLAAAAVILGSILFVAGVAQARQPVKLGAFGMGTGTDEDRETARSLAKDDAESKIICTGRLENLRVTVNCSKLGDGESATWMCMANATATCIID